MAGDAGPLLLWMDCEHGGLFDLEARPPVQAREPGEIILF